MLNLVLHVVHDAHKQYTHLYTNAPSQLHKSDASLLGFCYPREDSVKCS